MGLMNRLTVESRENPQMDHLALGVAFWDVVDVSLNRNCKKGGSWRLGLKAYTDVMNFRYVIVRCLMGFNQVLCTKPR